MNPQVTFDQNHIADFCQRWKVTELALFGSILLQDFGPDSDVDVLISFDPTADWNLWNLVEMKSELEEIFERQVDLVTRRAIERSENRIRRDAILQSAVTVYGSR